MKVLPMNLMTTIFETPNYTRRGEGKKSPLKDLCCILRESSAFSAVKVFFYLLQSVANKTHSRIALLFHKAAE